MKPVLVVALLLLAFPAAVCALTITVGVGIFSGHPANGILLKVTGMILLASAAVVVGFSKRAKFIANKPRDLVEKSRRYLEIVTIFVIAYGIVAILAASLWVTPMSGPCLVSGLIAFGGALILAVAIRRPRPMALSNCFPPDFPEPLDEKHSGAKEEPNEAN